MDLRKATDEELERLYEIERSKANTAYQLFTRASASSWAWFSYVDAWCAAHAKMNAIRLEQRQRKYGRVKKDGQA